MNRCPLCLEHAEPEYKGDLLTLDCRGCGYFRASERTQAYLSSLSGSQRASISAYTKRRTEYSERSVLQKRRRPAHLEKDEVKGLVEGADLASAAASEYGLQDATIELCGGQDFDNPTFEVRRSTEHYSLRVFAESYDQDLLRSQLDWMWTLRHEANLSVRCPVRTQTGSLLAEVSHSGGTTRRVALYGWIQGQRLESVTHEKRSPAFLTNIGSMVGELHNQAERREVPEWYRVPRHDASAYRDKIVRLAKENPFAYSDRELKEFVEEAPLLLDTMAQLGEGRQSFGLVNGDMGPWNIIVEDNKVSIIDFTSLRLEHYAVNLTKIRDLCLREEHFEMFLDGYRSVRSLSQDVVKSLRLFSELYLD